MDKFRCGFGSSKGNFLVRHLKIITPKLHKSTLVSYIAVVLISGAIYIKVPHGLKIVREFSTSLDTPKSAIFNVISLGCG